jgi:hypothetical protein
MRRMKADGEKEKTSADVEIVAEGTVSGVSARVVGSLADTPERLKALLMPVCWRVCLCDVGVVT